MQNCGATLRIIALIDDADVIERILKHLNVWEPKPETISSAGPAPPWPQGETLPCLTTRADQAKRLSRFPAQQHLLGFMVVPCSFTTWSPTNEFCGRFSSRYAISYNTRVGIAQEWTLTIDSDDRGISTITGSYWVILA